MLSVVGMAHMCNVQVLGGGRESGQFRDKL